MTVKEAIGNKDRAIIEECEAGEDRAVKAYREALAKDLPGAAGGLIKASSLASRKLIVDCAI